MTNITKITLASLAFAALLIGPVQASEITGTLSSSASAPNNGSQTGGTIGGNTGGGGNISGSVSDPDNGGGGGGGGGSSNNNNDNDDEPNLDGQGGFVGGDPDTTTGGTPLSQNTNTGFVVAQAPADTDTTDTGTVDQPTASTTDETATDENAGFLANIGDSLQDLGAFWWIVLILLLGIIGYLWYRLREEKKKNGTA